MWRLRSGGRNAAGERSLMAGKVRPAAGTVWGARERRAIDSFLWAECRFCPEYGYHHCGREAVRAPRRLRARAARLQPGRAVGALGPAQVDLAPDPGRPRDLAGCRAERLGPLPAG